MNLRTRLMRVAACIVQVLALAVPAGSAFAQATGATASTSSAAAAATKHLADAAEVVRKMAADPAVKNLLAQAKGVYTVPNYGRAALGLGAAGGAGVLSVRGDGGWSDPAFFNVGGFSVGLQAGVESGPIALILMNDKALDSFRKKNKFSLSANTGLTVVNWSTQESATAGAGDVIVWAANKGLFGNVATLSVNDIHFNKKANRAFYGKDVTIDDILSGKVTNPHSDIIKQILAGASGSAK